MEAIMNKAANRREFQEFSGIYQNSECKEITHSARKKRGGFLR